MLRKSFEKIPNKLWNRYLQYGALIVIICIIICRLISVHYVPDVFSDERRILQHIESLILTGRDADGNYLPFYFTVGNGLATYIYIYPMVALCKIFGCDPVHVRCIQQILTMVACLAVAYSAQIWSENRKMFWLTLFVTLTLPWGFVQANRIWDPAFVPVCFSVYLLFFTLLMKKAKITLWEKNIFSIMAFSFLVFLAVVYPPCRIPAVAMWVYSVVWAMREKKIELKQLVIIIIFDIIFSLPMAFNLFNPEFNSRTAELLVFQGGENLKGEIFQFVKNFSQMIDIEFLFVTGDANYRHAVPMYGMLGTISVIPLLYHLRRKLSPITIYMIFIIFFTFISTALTNEGIPHSLRSCLAWLPFSVIIAEGWDDILENKSNGIRIILYIILVVGFIIYFLKYMSFYLGMMLS